MSDDIDYIDFTFRLPDNKSVLTPVPGFEINFSHEMPNWWWRFWQFVLLGWRWRNLTMREPDRLWRRLARRVAKFFMQYGFVWYRKLGGR